MLSAQGVEGQKVWQKNNCSACHQVYGLGGYLGPDLTNVMGHPNKGPNYVKAFVQTAYKSMPKFNLSDDDIENLVSFLQELDQTGISPVTNQNLHMNGWLELEYK
jgi:nitric oxide reductase subunit C